MGVWTLMKPRFWKKWWTAMVAALRSRSSLEYTPVWGRRWGNCRRYSSPWIVPRLNGYFCGSETLAVYYLWNLVHTNRLPKIHGPTIKINGSIIVSFIGTDQRDSYPYLPWGHMVPEGVLEKQPSPQWLERPPASEYFPQTQQNTQQSVESCHRESHISHNSGR